MPEGFPTSGRASAPGGKPFSATAPAVGQLLVYDGTSWAPFSMPDLDLAKQASAMVTAGASAPALGNGSYTEGTSFFCYARGLITGMRFYWPGGAGAKTVKCCLWHGSSLQEAVNVSVNAAGLYTATWAGTYSLSADDYSLWTVSRWDNSGAKYLAVAESFFTTPRPATVFAFANYSNMSKPGVMIERFYVASVGDSYPNGPTNQTYSLCHPLVTVY